LKRCQIDAHLAWAQPALSQQIVVHFKALPETSARHPNFL
jgi:hypothetical protein